MLFKNFDKFSSVLHFSTLKLLLFSCRKSLRSFSAHILKLRFSPEMCVKNAKRRPKIITSCKTHVIIGSTEYFVNNLHTQFERVYSSLWAHSCMKTVIMSIHSYGGGIICRSHSVGRLCHLMVNWFVGMKS